MKEADASPVVPLLWGKAVHKRTRERRPPRYFQMLTMATMKRRGAHGVCLHRRPLKDEIQRAKGNVLVRGRAIVKTCGPL